MRGRAFADLHLADRIARGELDPRTGQRPCGFSGAGVIALCGGGGSGSGDIFGTTTPTGGAVIGNFSLGTKFYASRSGKITGVRAYYTAGQGSATRTAHLWSSAGTSLASVALTGTTATGWNTWTFATPYAIAASTEYVVSLYEASQGVGYTASLFASGDWQGTGGAYLWAYQNGGSAGNNGVYLSGSDGFPTSSGGNGYFVDALFSFP